MPSLYTLIKQDHRYAERLIDQLTADPSEVSYDDTARKNVADFLVAADSRHETAEELVLWPAVRRRIPGGHDLAEEGLRQEHEAKLVLDALRFADGNSRLRLAGEFAVLARAHMAFEDRTVLPAVRKATLWPGGWLLGAKFTMAKKVAPTRPHPHGPDRRLGLLTRGLCAAGLDRVRDKVTGRRP
jgi:hemerythrin-like domain-containing protein